LIELLSDPRIWTAFLTLTVLEIVLGIDNIVFISILTDRLPRSQRDKARVLGLGAAMIMWILLLFAIGWIMGLTKPWLEFLGRDISGRDLILLVGGFFLLAKATMEIHDKLEGEEHGGGRQGDSHLPQRDRADHAARHRLLTGFSHHGRGNGG
jgi:predicted tellurium resistance membrane protein TerC